MVAAIATEFVMSQLARALLVPVLLALSGVSAFAQQVQVYQLPEGARPHDVAPAPDGKVWYTAQRNGKLGILDPKTGDVREVPLGPKSSPHGVIQGPDGAAWITDSGQNAIVRFDPTTEEIKVWRLPEDTGYTNLNTAAFDKDGIHWFTGQNGIYGRLDPKSGEMKVFKAPKGRGPYGIAATPDGEVYYVSLAGSFLGKIDRATGETTVIEPPTPNQGARRVWSDSKGRLWISEWNSGQLSMHDPKDGSWKAWRAPGPNPKVYAVYVDERDMVWISDFGGHATHVFDPKTESFKTIPNSTEGANVRQILGRPGEVWLPESGADRLMVIRTGATQ
jgi:virginiamycin B lyase